MADDQSAPAPPRTVDAGDTQLMLLRQFLAATDDARCPRCGYDVRALAEPRCPECGIGLRLSIGASEPYLMRWVITTLAMTLPAGVGLLLSFFVLINGAEILFTQGPLVGVSGIAFLAAMPLLVLLLIFRRPFTRLPKEAQRVLTACAVFYACTAFPLWMIGSR